MATQGIGTDISLVAAADLSNSQFLAVKVDANGQAALAVLGDMAVGVLQNKVAAGQVATVRVSGITKMLAGGTIASGAQVASNAAGRAVAATQGRTNTSDAGASADPLIGSNVIGIALVGGVNNDVITVLLTHAGAVPTTLA